MTEKPLFIQSDALGPLMSSDAMSLLFGVTKADFDAEFDLQRLVAGDDKKFTMVFPAEWLKTARRNYAEISAAIGSDDFQKIVDYLQQKRDGGAAFRRESRPDHGH